MTTEEALKTLKDYNDWRRGKVSYVSTPSYIGAALDVAIDGLALLDDVMKDIALERSNKKYSVVQISTSILEDFDKWKVKHQ